MLDQKDHLLLKLLQDNSRISASEAGKELELSVPAASERIKKLLDGGYIKKFTAQLDSFIHNYQNIISDKDKNNFKSTMKNLSDVSSELKEGINKEIDKLDQMLNSFKIVTDKSEEISL